MPTIGRAFKTNGKSMCHDLGAGWWPERKSLIHKLLSLENDFTLTLGLPLFCDKNTLTRVREKGHTWPAVLEGCSPLGQGRQGSRQDSQDSGQGSL